MVKSAMPAAVGYRYKFGTRTDELAEEYGLRQILAVTQDTNIGAGSGLIVDGMPPSLRLRALWKFL